jgi:hypothetical protein
MIDRSCAQCCAIVEGIGALDGAQIIAKPALNQGLLRFVRPGGSEEANDEFTDEILAKINATGEAFFSGTTWLGRRATRVSVVNWRTNERDVKRAIGATASVLSREMAVGGWVIWWVRYRAEPQHKLRVRFGPFWPKPKRQLGRSGAPKRSSAGALPSGSARPYAAIQPESTEWQSITQSGRILLDGGDGRVFDDLDANRVWRWCRSRI